MDEKMSKYEQTLRYIASLEYGDGHRAALAAKNALTQSDAQGEDGAKTGMDHYIDSYMGVCKSLGELLAVIHRDGGHYQAAHGTDEAVRAAQVVVQELRSRLDEAETDAAWWKKTHANDCGTLKSQLELINKLIRGDDAEFDSFQRLLQATEEIIDQLSSERDVRDAYRHERDAALAEVERLKDELDKTKADLICTKNAYDINVGDWRVMRIQLNAAESKLKTDRNRLKSVENLVEEAFIEGFAAGEGHYNSDPLKHWPTSEAKRELEKL